MSEIGSEHQPKRTGFVLLAHVLISRLLSLIGLNLVFYVTALPVVTLPNALTSLYRCTSLLLKEEEFPLLKTYFKAFQSEFLKTLAAGWTVLLLLAGAVYGALFYWSVNSAAALVGSFLCAVLAVYLYVTSCNLFYMLSRIRLPFGALLKNSFLLVFLQPLRKTAYCLFSLAIFCAAAWWFPRTLPVILLIICSLAALIACYGVRDKIEQSVVR
jgi:uncharacterized membrane protein YesL